MSKRLNRVLTVDPGWNTGWAYWTRGSFHPSTGILISKYTDPTDKLNDLSDQFGQLLTIQNPRFVMMEGTSFWVESLKSQVSFSRGDAIYLTYLIGQYMRECYLQKKKFDLILAIDWKGQMDDKKVKKRVLRRNAVDYKQFHGQYWPHVTDAVGIGLWMLGIF